MLDKILTHYTRYDGISPDFAEKASNGCLYCIRTACGKSYQVTDNLLLQDKARIAKRIAHFIIAVFTFPLIIAGAALVHLSKTHGIAPLKQDPVIKEKGVDALNTKENNPNIPSPSKAEVQKPVAPAEVKDLTAEAITEIKKGANPRKFGIDTLDKIKELLQLYGKEIDFLYLENLDLTTDFDLITSAASNVYRLYFIDCKLPGDISSVNSVKKLECLGLINCGLTDTQVEQISPFIKQARHLDFDTNQLTDKSFELILKPGGWLNLLDLSSNNITSKSLSLLNDSSRLISDLYIEKNNLTIEDIGKLRNPGRFKIFRFVNKDISKEEENNYLSEYRLSPRELSKAINNHHSLPGHGIFNLVDLRERVDIKDLRYLNLSNYTINEGNDLLALIDECPKLTGLDLRSSIFSAAFLQKLLQKKKIQDLNLQYCKLSDEHFNALANTEGCLSLSKLRLDNTDMSDEQFTRIINSAHLANLNQFFVSANKLTDASALALASTDRPNLKFININHNLIKEEGVKAILNNLDRFPQLDMIYAAGNPLSPLIFKDVKRFNTNGKIYLDLKRRPRVELEIPPYCIYTAFKEPMSVSESIDEELFLQTGYLHLESIPNDEETTKICQMKDLESLTLNGIAIPYVLFQKLIEEGNFTKFVCVNITLGDRGFDILTATSNASRLTRIELTNANVSDEQFKKLIKSSHLQGLTSITIDSGNLSDRSVDMLLEQERPILEKLKLRNNKLTSGGVVKLVNDVNKFANLDILDLKGNNVSIGKLAEIKKIRHGALSSVRLTRSRELPPLPDYVEVMDS